MALEQEILRFADGGLVAPLHSNLALWTAARRWRGLGDELLSPGSNKYDPARPSRTVVALEQVRETEIEEKRRKERVAASEKGTQVQKSIRLSRFTHPLIKYSLTNK